MGLVDRLATIRALFWQYQALTQPEKLSHRPGPAAKALELAIKAESEAYMAEAKAQPPKEKR
jgi:hypothetical protein